MARMTSVSYMTNMANINGLSISAMFATFAVCQRGPCLPSPQNGGHVSGGQGLPGGRNRGLTRGPQALKAMWGPSTGRENCDQAR
jgi:hypothetical protein